VGGGRYLVTSKPEGSAALEEPFDQVVIASSPELTEEERVRFDLLVRALADKLTARETKAAANQ